MKTISETTMWPSCLTTVCGFNVPICHQARLVNSEQYTDHKNYCRLTWTVNVELYYVQYLISRIRELTKQQHGYTLHTLGTTCSSHVRNWLVCVGAYLSRQSSGTVAGGGRRTTPVCRCPQRQPDETRGSSATSTAAGSSLGSTPPAVITAAILSVVQSQTQLGYCRLYSHTQQGYCQSYTAGILSAV